MHNNAQFFQKNNKMETRLCEEKKGLKFYCTYLFLHRVLSKQYFTFFCWIGVKFQNPWWKEYRAYEML